MIDRIISFVEQHRMLQQGDCVTVGLSGGADSVALLLLLLDAGADVCAAHFEHGIRGGDSVADMAFCQELCARLGVPFFCERADVRHLHAFLYL